MAKKKTEPTLHDVFNRFDVVLGQFDIVLNKFDAFSKTLTRQLSDVSDQVVSLGQDVHRMSAKVDDVAERLEGVERAIDTDAATIINHERRITRLEKARV